MFNVKSQSLNIRAKFESHLRIKKKNLASVVAHSFKSSIQEAEAGRMLSLELAWST